MLTRDPSGWHTQTVDTYPYISDSTSIAVDDAGRPHIAYTYYDCPDRARDLTQLNHTFWDGSNWQIEKVDISAAYPGSYLSIAMDNAGYPRIAHSGGFLDYVYKDRPAGILKRSTAPEVITPIAPSPWISAARPTSATGMSKPAN